jgi:epoxyqueuosine reductase
MSPAEIKSALLAKARALGFDDCRVAPALPAAHREVFEQWIAEGKHGDMAWMARNMERRTDPCVVLPGARSVIVLAMNYFQGSGPENGYRIARYAWNDDYHDLIEKKLRELDAFLTAHGGTQKPTLIPAPFWSVTSPARPGWAGAARARCRFTASSAPGSSWRTF